MTEYTHYCSFCGCCWCKVYWWHHQSMKSYLFTNLVSRLLLRPFSQGDHWVKCWILMRHWANIYVNAVHLQRADFGVNCALMRTSALMEMDRSCTSRGLFMCTANFVGQHHLSPPQSIIWIFKDQPTYLSTMFFCFRTLYTSADVWGPCSFCPFSISFSSSSID